MAKQCSGPEVRQREDPELHRWTRELVNMAKGLSPTGNDHLVFHTKKGEQCDRHKDSWGLVCQRVYRDKSEVLPRGYGHSSRETKGATARKANLRGCCEGTESLEEGGRSSARPWVQSPAWQLGIWGRGQRYQGLGIWVTVKNGQCHLPRL